MVTHLTEMRGFIEVSSAPSEVEVTDLVVETFDDEPMDIAPALLEDLQNLQFKFESFRELDEDQQFALGVEMGMSKAAEMLENLIRKHR